MHTQPEGKHLATACQLASRTEVVGDIQVWNRQLHQLEPELSWCATPLAALEDGLPRLPHEGDNATVSGNPSAPPARLREHPAAIREHDTLCVGRLYYGFLFDTPEGVLTGQPGISDEDR